MGVRINAVCGKVYCLCVFEAEIERVFFLLSFLVSGLIQHSYAMTGGRAS